MSALTLSMKFRPRQRVDMSPLVCDQLENLDPTEIAAIELQSGKRKIRVDELFSISGSNTQDILIKHSFNKLDFIGKGLTCGRIIVEGDAGAYIGMAMQGGEIIVQGSVEIYAACEMQGGLLLIEEHAGDLLGGALPGNKQGMKGGTVIVKGNAADRAGDHMRRGNILIEGDAGDYCGSRMIAGTIAVMGQVGKHPGYAMRRGTLLLWNQPPLPPTFKDCGSHTLAFLPILFASFSKLDTRFAEASAGFSRVHRYGGDIAELGRGEILVKI